MADKVKTITLGALLHDTGKIIFRAEKHLSHSEEGARLLEEEKFVIPDKSTVIDIVRYHHKESLRRSGLPPSHPAYLVYEADNIASALDRRPEDEEDRKQGFERYTPLESVFNLLGGREKGVSRGYRAFTLRLEEGIPYPQEKNFTLTPGDYARLRHYMEENLSKINYNLESPDSVLKIMEAVASFIPSSTYQGEIPDISLFDHVKITAALAASMYLYLQEKGITDYKALFMDEDNARRFRQEEAFMLVLADISGIQDFIYTISSRGALKSLRARSFYLDLMCEHMADEILEALNLSRAHLLYSGGGHFRLLLPNTAQAREVIALAREKFNRWFFKQYATSLYIEMATLPVSGDVLAGKGEEGGSRLKKAFNELAYRANIGKMRRYRGKIGKEIFFNPPDIDAGRECPVCRTSSGMLLDDPFQQGMVICQNCLSLRNIGGKLGREKDSLLIVVDREKPAYNPDFYLEIPALREEEMYLGFADEERVRKDLEKGNLPVRIYSVNRLYTGVNMATNLWVGNYSREPQNKEEGYIDFQELAAASKGIKRLGVLRADVDNLGFVFAEGLKQEGKDPYRFLSLSRVATLSRQLSLFFKYYINLLCQGKNRLSPVHLTPDQKEEPALAIVYSGGDDLFIVGAWNEVIDLALDLSEAFNRYSGGKLTLSAGIGLYRPGFPISQMANLTGEMEKRAKEYKSRLGEKNAVCLFGWDELNPEHNHIYHWQEFKEKVLGEKYHFLNQVLHLEASPPPEGKIAAGMSLLYRLLFFLTEINDDKGRINLARLAYQLARIQVPSGAGEATRKAYEELKRKLYVWATDKEECRQLITALHLLIYINRQEEGENYGADRS
ncbi:CRISPR-associated protein Csm1 [Thermosyntropha lipolytica DSM 11003]|uniref:CRISPR system single-strand-specific deoxyribonuclease Cas10/Csm1 (subtype III-A) n=1 Tax=Thermosyntropha lipolytica DSM 11003 TaxID=1123382 RepID=A0A1M5RL02_9FIRM|nr:type III-A CRISPR-associated protein Cas10/Csm1 [Thermosyntropha lipolytica]SHH26806.1 CRISPR-associated protein Csm1 [Thermosyntropha lipolytica DSM 11003]